MFLVVLTIDELTLYDAASSFNNFMAFNQPFSPEIVKVFGETVSATSSGFAPSLITIHEDISPSLPFIE